MVTWAQFEEQSPEIARAGYALIYQFGIGLGYLATVRADGGPRLHPFCPIVFDGHLYGLIIDSPKRRDLLRDGRFAIHTFSPQEVDDEFYLTGRAHLVTDADLRERVRGAFLATGGTSTQDEELFEFAIQRVLLATYGKRGTPEGWPPRYQKWQDSRALADRSD